MSTGRGRHRPTTEAQQLIDSAKAHPVAKSLWALYWDVIHMVVAVEDPGRSAVAVGKGSGVHVGDDVYPGSGHSRCIDWLAEVEDVVKSLRTERPQYA